VDLLRRLLGGTLVLGLVGTGSELVLLGHYEDAAQYTPLIVIAVGLVVVAWLMLRPSAASIAAARIVMAACMATGAIGIGLHYDGNEEFELEMYPTLSGWQLLSRTLTGATPVLAPGAMTLIGLIGLAHVETYPQAGRVFRRRLEE
jgi:hypothetical protein